MTKNTIITLFFVLATLCYGCESSNDATQPEQPTKPAEPEQGSTIPDREGVTIKGRVTATDGTQLAGVVISDGEATTTTDAYGRYWLRSKVADAMFVMISIPSGYEVVSKEAMPEFFARINHTAKGVQQFDFELTPVDNTDHVMVVMTDMHIAGRTPSNGPIGGAGTLDIDQFKNQFVPDLQKTLSKLPASTRVYGLNLGDMTHDTFWVSNGVSFPEYKNLIKEFPFPIFHVMGNHDYDCSVTDLVDGDSAAEAAYHTNMGPTYYSFNIGEVHYIVLDDMIYINAAGARDYRCAIDNKQMGWLKRDMALLPKSVKRIVVALHVPTERRNVIADKSRFLENRSELYAALSGYDVTILAGHTHFSESVVVSPRITEYIHSSICGCWWYVPTCIDGSPASYSVYHSQNETFTRSVKGINIEDEFDNECRLYTTARTDENGNPCLLMNLWNWNPSWNIAVYENDVQSAIPVKIIGYDPLYQQLYDDRYVSNNVSAYSPYKTDHLFVYTPKNPQATLRVILTDDKKNKYERITSLE